MGLFGSSTNPSQSNIFEGGTQAYGDEAVEVRTGVSYYTVSDPIANPTTPCDDKTKTRTGADDGIAIKIKCAKNPHLVQFINREIIGADGQPIDYQMQTTGGSYHTTTDPKNPIWNTDSAVKTNAYYEAGGASRQDDDSLTTFDQPSLRPGAGQTWRANFKAYAICNGKVVRQVEWVREQVGDAAPTYTVNVSQASALPDWAKNQLKAQGYDTVP